VKGGTHLWETVDDLLGGRVRVPFRGPKKQTGGLKPVVASKVESCFLSYEMVMMFPEGLRKIA